MDTYRLHTTFCAISILTSSFLKSTLEPDGYVLYHYLPNVLLIFSTNPKNVKEAKSSMFTFRADTPKMLQLMT